VTLAPGGGSGGTVGSLPIVIGPGGIGGMPIPITNATPVGGMYIFTPPVGMSATYYLWIIDGVCVGGGALNPIHPAVAVDATVLQSTSGSSVVLAFLNVDGTSAVLYDLSPLVH